MMSTLTNATRCARNPRSLVEAGWRILIVAALALLSSCRTSSGSPDILLFNGGGTSPNDVAALERILDENHFNYATANSRQLNRMSESQLRAYRLLIVP